MNYRVRETVYGRFIVEKQLEGNRWISVYDPFDNKEEAIGYMHAQAEEDRIYLAKTKAFEEKVARGEHIVATVSIDS